MRSRTVMLTQILMLVLYANNLINSTLELGSWETTLFRRYPATLTILFKFCVLNTNKVYLQIKY